MAAATTAPILFGRARIRRRQRQRLASEPTVQAVRAVVTSTASTSSAIWWIGSLGRLPLLFSLLEIRQPRCGCRAQGSGAVSIVVDLHDDGAR